MEGVCLRFFSNEFQKHKGKLLYEWLLEFAKKHEVHGGMVLRGIAGFGRHGVIHHEHFFELASNVPIEVSFYMKKEEALNLIKLVREEKIDLFYSLSSCEFGTAITS